MQYKYSGFDGFGKKTDGLIEASSIQNVKAKLKEKQIIPIDIVLFEQKEWQLFGNRTAKRHDLYLFSQNLAIYLDGGVSLISSLKLLSTEQKKNTKQKQFLDVIYTHLNEGKSFFTALESQKVFTLPQFYLQSIKVSENGGMLSSVLKELAGFLKDQDKIEKQITNALAYPLFIFIVSFGAIGFLLAYVVPQMSSMFSQLNQELPLITQIVLGISAFVTNNYLIMLIAIFISIGGFFVLYKNNPEFALKTDLFLLKIPFIGTLIESSELSRFAYIASLLINSGVGVAQAIKLSAGVLNNKGYKKLFEEASNKVVEGEKLSASLKNKELNIDTSFVQAVAIGEETSSLYVILQNLAFMYKEKTSDKITIILSLLEPTMMLIVGGFVGVVVISILMPIFSMNIG